MTSFEGRARWAKFLLPLGVMILAWGALFGAQVAAAVYRYCAEHWDFGIYVQAIARFSWRELNPWLSARGVFIFGDHFDPILFAALVPRLVLPANQAGFVTEQLFILGATVPIAVLWHKRVLDALDALMLCAVLLFGMGTLDAALFPIHPTTWTLLPAVMLGASWARKWEAGIVLSTALLFACKEEHVLCGPFLVLGLWRAGFRRAFWVTTALTVGWAAFAFGLRPVLWGPTVPYAGDLLSALASDPFGALGRGLRAPHLVRLGTLLAPFVPLAGWAVWKRRYPGWPLALATLPLLATRFLTDKWTYQYGPPLAGLWVASVLPLLSELRPPKWVTAASLVLVLTSSESALRSAVARFPGTNAVCPSDPTRLQEIEMGLRYLHEHKEGAAWVSSTLLAPIADRPDIYSFSSPTRQSGLAYRYLLIEKPPTGYHWPLNPDEVTRRIQDFVGRPSTRIVADGRYVLLAEGDFSI